MSDDRFEKRLAEIAGAVTNLSQRQQTSEIQDKIRETENNLASRVTQAEAEVLAQEKRLAAALEEGDPVTQARAQRLMGEAITARSAAEAQKANYEARMRQLEKKAQEAPKREQAEPEPQDDTNLKSWTAKNASWYGLDAEMTKAAKDVGTNIENAGVITTGSKEYFEAVDRQMAQKYPDKFGSTPETAGSGGNTAPGSGKANIGRIPRSVLEGYERMGIDTSNKETLERMVAHRTKLVEKGILPQEPVTERVVS